MRGDLQAGTTERNPRQVLPRPHSTKPREMLPARHMLPPGRTVGVYKKEQEGAGSHRFLHKARAQQLCGCPPLHHTCGVRACQHDRPAVENAAPPFVFYTPVQVQQDE